MSMTGRAYEEYAEYVPTLEDLQEMGRWYAEKELARAVEAGWAEVEIKESEVRGIHQRAA